MVYILFFLGEDEVKYIFGFIFIIFSIQTNANTSIRTEKSCEHLSKFARATMEYRQQNGDVAEFIQMINNSDFDKEVKQVYKNITHDAFESPKWETKNNQQKEAQEFSNKTYMFCINALNKKAPD